MQLRRRSELSDSGRRRYPRALIAAAIAGLAAVAVSGLALASSPVALSIAANVKVHGKAENVVVNRRGLTVYTLSGERIGHLKCTKANQCFSAWFPVTPANAKARLASAHGIKGKLGKLHRNGFTQITLAGRPLYTFIGDAGKKRRATGEGIVSFGGTWHVVAASASHGASMVSPGAPGTTSTTTSAPYRSY